MEDYVDFEQAIKLEEFGFDWECSNNDMTYLGVKTPTLSQAQKWLREVKKIHIIVRFGICGKHYDKPYCFEIYQDNGEVFLGRFIEYEFRTYENALSEALDKALELLKDE